MFLEEGLLKEIEKRNKNKSAEERLIEKIYNESSKKNIEQLFLNTIKQAENKQKCLNKLIYEIVKKIYDYYEKGNELKIFRKIVDCLDNVVNKNYDNNSYKTFQMQKKYLINYLSIIDCSKQQSLYKPSKTSKTKDVFVFNYCGGILINYNPKRYHCVGRLTEKKSLQDYLEKGKEPAYKITNVENSMLGITNIINVKINNKNDIKETVAKEDVIRKFTNSVKSNNLNTIKLVLNCHGTKDGRYMITCWSDDDAQPMPLDFMALLSELNHGCLSNKNIEIINSSCYEGNKFFFKDGTIFKKAHFDLNKVICDFAKSHNGIVTYTSVMSDKIINGSTPGHHFYEYKYLKKKENDNPEFVFIIQDENLIKQYLEEKQKFLNKMDAFFQSSETDDADNYFNELYAVLISEYPLILDFKEKSKQEKNELLKRSVINNKTENGLKSKENEKDCLIF